MELSAFAMDFVQDSGNMELPGGGDQCVLVSELNVEYDQEKKSYIIIPASKLWLAIDLVARVYLPSAVKSIRNQLLPALGAFLANSFVKSLASVQKIPIPMRSRQRFRRKQSMEQEHKTESHNETIIKDHLADDTEDEINLEKDEINRLVEAECQKVMEQETNRRGEQSSPEKCVDCRVLYEPEGEIFADIVFVHGLHGGLDRTWKQGTWRKTNTFKLKNKKLIKKPSDNLNHYVCDTEQSPKRRSKKLDSKIPSKLAKTTDRDKNSEKENPMKESATNSTVINKEFNGNSSVASKMEIDNNPPDSINHKQESSHSRVTDITQENKSNTKTSDTLDLEYFSDGSSSCDDAEDLENLSSCWPKDWLPVDCPQCRIVTINYTTDVLWCPVWQRKRIRTNLVERSHEMTEKLLELGLGSRPIIWVGHSKGGLFIKQIILNGFESQGRNLDHYSLYEKSKAIMFYSVPHKGSSLADVTFPFFRRSVELLEIKRNCDFVVNLHKRFLEVFSEENGHKPEIFSFIDTVATKMGIMNIEMIAYESADPDIGTKCDVPLNHREICKPSGRDCLLYQELVHLIKRCLNIT